MARFLQFGNVPLCRAGEGVQGDGPGVCRPRRPAATERRERRGPPGPGRGTPPVCTALRRLSAANPAVALELRCPTRPARSSRTGLGRWHVRGTRSYDLVLLVRRRVALFAADWVLRSRGGNSTSSPWTLSPWRMRTVIPPPFLAGECSADVREELAFFADCGASPSASSSTTATPASPPPCDASTATCGSSSTSSE